MKPLTRAEFLQAVADKKVLYMVQECPSKYALPRLLYAQPFGDNRYSITQPYEAGCGIWGIYEMPRLLSHWVFFTNYWFAYAYRIKQNSKVQS
jgi:hypothetical protein